MPLTLFQVDAFTDHLFHGNPAAVVPLTQWLPDPLLQSIAEENNLAETAFFVPTTADSEAEFHLRWFTPVAEVDLCGHATLASASVLFDRLGYLDPEIRFRTRSGILTVTRTAQGLRMLLPAATPQPVPAPPTLAQALGIVPLETLAAYDLIAVLPTEEDVRILQPDFHALAQLPFRGIVITAQAQNVTSSITNNSAAGTAPVKQVTTTATDFVSRFFGPQLGIPEDPVTGSAHCELMPYWSARLGRTTLRARQLSRRGGTVVCELLGTHVALTGSTAHYMRAELELPMPTQPAIAD